MAVREHIHDDESDHKCHPLLSGFISGSDDHEIQGKVDYCGLSKAQSEALSAMCMAIIPPLKVVGHGTIHEDMMMTPYNQHVRTFLQTSGSDNGVPQLVANRIQKKVPNEARLLLLVTLWVLSTRLGTVLLCGRESLKWKTFPYIQRFADISLERRERVMQRWSRSGGIFFFLKLVFVVINVLCNFTFYSTINANGKNVAWDAIGYKVNKPKKLPFYKERPLDKGIINIKDYQATSTDHHNLIQSLSSHGLNVSISAAENDLINLECDVVVVGSGCGGGVAAAVLAKSGYKVVVVEKGNYFYGNDISSLEGPSLTEMYESGGLFATVDGKFMILAGSTVGGGSAVNWSACIKTPDHILSEWSDKHKLPLFGQKEYMHAMDVVCERIGVTDKCKEEGFQNKILRSGCEILGLKCDVVPRNSPENHFCGNCCYGCPTGEKRGTDTTWLVDAVNNGAIILTGLKADKFLFEQCRSPKKKRCIGLMGTTTCGFKKLRIEIRAKLSVSSCGALLTPPLLIRSGLKNPNIGTSLHLHPVVMAWGYFPESDSMIEGKVNEGGIITSIHKMQSEYNGSNSDIILETPRLGPATYSAVIPWLSGADMKEKMLRFTRTSFLFALVRDEGSGEVKEEGRVKYHLKDVDTKRLHVGLKRALRILIAAGATEVGTLRSDGHRLVVKGTKEEDLAEFIDGVTVEGGPYAISNLFNLYSSAHQMGSCRMGVNAKEGAVDVNGESWEAEGLFVCDASLLPSALGVNPMITIESLAYCVSQKMVEHLQKKA